MKFVALILITILLTSCKGGDDSPASVIDATPGIDADSDGHQASLDCDDSDPTVYQTLSYNYIDTNGDTYTISSAGSICAGDSLPMPYKTVSNGADCNDSDSAKYQNLTVYTDGDLDTYGTGVSSQLCAGATPPSGLSLNNSDCNDADISLYQNLTLYSDSDFDGYGSGSSSTICSGPSPSTGYSTNNLDSFPADSNHNVYLGTTFYNFINGSSGEDIVIDSTGNIFIVGYSWYGDFDFTSGVDYAGTNSGGGALSGFITKINSDGAYGWTRSIGQAGTTKFHGVAVDSNDNIYVTGFSSGADFDFTAGTDTHTPVGYVDAFITKINSDSTYGWTRMFGGNIFDAGYKISINSSDDIFVIGAYQNGPIDFDFTAGTDIKGVDGQSGGFVIMTNPSGSYNDSIQLPPGSWSNTDWSLDITNDSNDNIFVTGGFQGTFDFDFTAGGDSRTSNGLQDIYVLKINSNGTYGWTKTMGGTGAEKGKSIAVDSSDNIYVAGKFNTLLDFDFSGGTDSISPSSDYDGFVTKINSDGSYDSTFTLDLPIYRLTIDSSNNIFTLGHSGSSMTVSKISSDSTTLWSKTFSGNTSYVPDNELNGQAIYSSKDRVYLTGNITTQVNFDYTSGVDNQTNGFFLTRF